MTTNNHLPLFVAGVIITRGVPGCECSTLPHLATRCPAGCNIASHFGSHRFHHPNSVILSLLGIGDEIPDFSQPNITSDLLSFQSQHPPTYNPIHSHHSGTMSKFGNMTSDTDFNTVTVLRKHAPPVKTLKSTSDINAAQRQGAEISTNKKYFAGSNRQHKTEKNTARLDEETEELHHEKVSLSLGMAMQRARQTKEMTQKDLATVSGLVGGEEDLEH